MEKTCRRCGRTLPIGEFYRDKKSKDGRNPICRLCTKKQRAYLPPQRRGRWTTPEQRDSDLLENMRKRFAEENEDPPYEW